MKFIHLSDLHIGKRVNEFSMLDDQRYILNQILSIVDAERPDGVLIAGDVYDKSIPTVEAIQLLDYFLRELAHRSVPVFIVSGNHDSPERIAFAAELLSPAGIHISPAYTGVTKPFVLRDEHGPVNIYLLPFVKPIHVRMAYPESDVHSYTEAVREAIRNMNVDETQRNVIVAHQFVTGAIRADSEEISLGGSDNVDVTVFDPFDYVALGHIHRPQRLTRDTVRYSGTPLKYSFSECNDNKSVTVVELEEKGNVSFRLIPLTPLHDLRELRGTYEDLTNRENYKGTATDDYLHITLTDEDDVLDAMAKLRVIYPNLMKLTYDNTRTRFNSDFAIPDGLESKSPMDLFGDFYNQQNNAPLDDDQIEYLRKIMEHIWED